MYKFLNRLKTFIFFLMRSKYFKYVILNKKFIIIERRILIYNFQTKKKYW